MWPEPLRIWWPAGLVGLVVAILVGGAAHLMISTALERSTPVLEQATRAGAEAVGQSVAAQFARALELGIPLDRLPGIESHLRRIVETSPQVQGLALLGGDGRIINATAPDVAGLHYPILGGATLVIATESFLIEHTKNELRIILAVAALLTGIVAGGIVAGFLAFHQNPSRLQFAQALDRIVKGDFGARLPSEGRGSLTQAARALSRCMETVDQARRRLAEAVATVRAIDFDGALGTRAERIVQPLESRYVFAGETLSDAPGRTAESRRIAALWRVALIAGFYASAFPLVANFAIDRESVVVPPAWSPVLPILAELGAAALGAMLGRARFGGSAIALGIGCIILGLCLGATYWCRSYEDFVLLRAGSGLAVGLVAGGLLGGISFGDVPRHLFSAIVFAALLAAPVIGGLLTEAVGRRGGFFVLGAAVLLLMPFIASGGRQLGQRSESSSAGAFGMSDLLLGLAVLPATALVLVRIPAGFGLENYLQGAAPIVLMAVCALLVPALSPLACGTVLLGAAAVLAFTPETIVSLSLACAMIGIASGGMIKAVSGSIGRPWLSLGCGIGLALMATGASASFLVPFAAIVASVAIVLVAIHFACWPRAAVSAM